MEKKRILIVDDEPHVIRILNRALQRNGYDTLTAPNGRAGFDKISEYDPDVVVTDIQMPHMTGRDLCLKITREIPDRRFLICVMTSRTEFEHREWTGQIDQLIFLEKPVSTRQLLPLLERYFATRENGVARAQ